MKPSEQTPTIGPKSGDMTQPAKSAPPFTPKQDPKETAQEAVHQVTPRDSIKKDDVKPPLHAAKGNDEVMSQQQQQPKQPQQQQQRQQPQSRSKS